MRLFDEDDLTNTLLQVAQQQFGDRIQCVTGFVSSYDPSSHRVRCIVPSWFNPGSSELTLTGWIPLASQWTGNGWGMQFAPFGGATQTNPTGGEQVLLTVYSDRNGTYIGTALLWSDKVAVALPTLAAGEGVLKHSSGSALYFRADGSVLIQSAAGLTATVGGDLTATVTGGLTATVEGSVSVTTQQSATINATGGATVTSAASVVVEAPSVELGSSSQISGGSLQSLVNGLFESTYNNHTHSDPQGGISSTPSLQMGPTMMTTTVKGG